MNTFSITQAFVAAWDAIQKNPTTVIIWGALAGSFQAIILLLFPAEIGVNGVFGTSSVVNFVVGSLLSFIIVYAETVLSLCIRREASLTLMKNWKLHVLPTVVVATVFFFLILSLGLIAFVIPGLVFIAAYSMFSYVIVDKEVGIIASFQESARLTKGARWKILALIAGTIGLISLAMFLGGALEGLIDSPIPPTVVSFLTEVFYGIIALALSLVSADAYLQLSSGDTNVPTSV